MALFQLRRTAPLPLDEAWRGHVVSLRHGAVVPMTRVRATKTVPSPVGGGVVTRTRVIGTTAPWRGHVVSLRHASSRGRGAVRRSWKRATGGS